jgi:hypothetical protein
MDTLMKDELGFLRPRKRERITTTDLRRLLGASSDEEIYLAGVKGGSRTAEPLSGQVDVDIKPGDTISVGPRITKGIDTAAEQLRKEVLALQRAGFGSIGSPVKKEWGWELRLNGLILPGGVRTDALVLVPLTYPIAGPIGFYVRKGTAKGNLDPRHLYDSTYHGAPDLTNQGWQWFCGVIQNWRPGRHTLISYVSIVLSMFNEQRA